MDDTTSVTELLNAGGGACSDDWPKATRQYSELISDHGRDSHYLRARGLKPTLIDMIGDCSNLRVLDAGSGDGWLLDELKPSEGYACDIVSQPNISRAWIFEIQDVRAMSYPSGFFDVVVASLLLMWIEEVDLAIAEMSRVTRRGGKMIVSLVHPYFYRTGSPDIEGNFVVVEDLFRPFRIDGLRIGGIAGPLSYYYRPFPDYVNACANAGLRIRQLRDWFIDIEDYKEKLSLGMDSDVRRSGKIPLYSFIECTKE